MKALELLQRNLINMAIANPMERLEISGYEVNEAIAELEEAMKPKSCEGCRDITWNNNSQSYKCAKSVTAGYLNRIGTSCISKDFYCNRYEPKEI